MAKERVLGLDLVRVIAIFVVIGIYHNFGYARSHFYKEAITLSLVYTSLGAFTFLSSFLLSSRYNLTDKTEIVSFYKKRVVRIWPLFAISSFALFMIHFNSLIPTLKGLVGLSPFWAPAPTTMWYVAMLISLYILTPFVVRGNIKRQLINSVLVMTVVGTIQIVFKSVVPKTFNYYSVYLIGLLLGRNFYDSTMQFLSSKKSLMLSGLWVFLLMIVYISNNAWLKSFTGVLGIVALLSLCLIISNVFSRKTWFVTITSTLSYASFCAYLFHREVIWVILHIKTFESGWKIFLEVLLIGVSLSFIIAYIIQHLYDSFIQRLK